MSEPKKRPGPLWMLFYGRRRSGFPWLLAGVIVAVFVLGLTFAIPGGADKWRGIAPALLGVTLVGGLVSAVIAIASPRRRR